MLDPLDGDVLLSHISALAYTIGPRPPGHPAEERARAYIRQQLQSMGAPEPEEQPFRTADTWGYALASPFALSLVGSVLGRWGRVGAWAGAALGITGAYLTWRAVSGLRQPLDRMGRQRPSANLIVRIPPTGERRRTMVLVGHTDTNRHRGTFSQARKAALPLSSTALLALQLAGAAAQVAGAPRLGRALALGQLVGLGLILADETGPFVDGANDNASAVACLLGIGATLQAAPMEHTEVWLAFTGAEEVGSVGMHTLLDRCGEQLRDAWFLDFELVGRGRLAYAAHHSGFSYLSGYAPDAESLALVKRAACAHPHVGVCGQRLMMLEEVAALRRRDYRAICLVGLDADGWPGNWHRESDTADNIEPAALERAARFGLEVLRTLDGEACGKSTPGAPLP
jgi:hypothetical protein